MPREFERRFLVRSGVWQAAAAARAEIEQGYLSRAGDTTVRVRRIDAAATLAVKVRDAAPGRVELEYPIPVEHAEFLLSAVCERPPIRKIRHTVPYCGQLWSVDVFEGVNHGLVLAEIELADPGAAMVRPFWLGDEITDDPRFRNSSLFRRPFGEWGRAVSLVVGE
ncbi:MAG: CYTH domain-containing protein [Magnetospirillum sp.]|nr:CYTH domain-containing protein [Magnetospirillum sp.]